MRLKTITHYGDEYNRPTPWIQLGFVLESFVRIARWWLPNVEDVLATLQQELE